MSSQTPGIEGQYGKPAWPIRNEGTQTLTCINAERLTRVTLVDDRKPVEEGGGIQFEQYGIRVSLSVQDDGRTLKVFVRSGDEGKTS